MSRERPKVHHNFRTFKVKDKTTQQIPKILTNRFQQRENEFSANTKKDTSTSNPHTQGYLTEKHLFTERMNPHSQKMLKSIKQLSSGKLNGQSVYERNMEKLRSKKLWCLQ